MSIKVVPVVGERTVVQALDGQPLEFTVDISQGSVARSENTLEITLNDGTEIYIENFFVVAEESSLPPLILADGSEVEATEFLGAINPDLDLTTAAGPSATPLSSGTSYSDDGGALIGGLDRLGDLDGFLSNAVRETGGQIDFFQPAMASAAGGTAQAPGTPVTPGVPDIPGVPVIPGVPEEPEGNPPMPGPEPTIVGYLRVGLMQVGLRDQGGHINDPRVELDVTLLTSVDNPAVSISLGANSQYSVAQDPVTGKIIFKLKNPVAGDVPPSETAEIVVDGKTYFVQIGSTSGSEMSDITTWPPANEGVANLEMAWGGLTDGHRTGVTLTTPAGYETGELHLQMRDSSLGDSSFELEKGSLYISNEGGSNSPDIVYTHNENVSLNYISGLKDDGEGPTASVQYDADLTATVYAAGADASTDITVKEGSVVIEAGLAEIDTRSTSTISGVFAGNEASTNVTASDITVHASSGGFSDGSAGLDAGVSAVRADGVKINYETDSGGRLKEKSRENSAVELKSDGDIDLGVTALEGGDHSGITYAAVAATDNGHVDINAGNGVTITATDTTETDAAGVYGIFSGYGMGVKDLLTLDDFESHEYIFQSDYYKTYLGELAYYYNAQRKKEVYNEELGEYEEVLSHELSEVNINAKDNVSVQVNLGENDTDTSAAGIKLSFGDVSIKSQGDIDVGLTHTGAHGGDSNNFLSAIDVTHGYFSLVSEGDVRLNLEANGDNLAVYNSDKTAFGSYLNYGMKDTAIVAKNIEFTGIAGADKSSAENHILGIRAFGKKETFAVQAEEKFSIDVTAHNNGGATSSVGIHAIGIEHYSHFLLSVDAPLFEINAHVAGGAGSDSQATGIRLDSGIDFGLGIYSGMGYNSGDATRFDKFSMNVGGGLVNTGLAAVAPATDDRNGYESRANVFAEHIDIKVTGDSQNSSSASYGLRASRHDSVNPHEKSSTITMHTSDFNLAVEDTHNSTALQADGFGTSVKITSQHYDYNGDVQGPLTVKIISKNLSADDLKGMAIEAIDGGKVEIIASDSHAYNDFIQIDGHIEIWSQLPSTPSFVTIDTGLGNDHIEINGDIINNKPTGNIIVDAGEGNDSVILNGKIDAPTSNTPLADRGGYYEGDTGFYLTGGEGYDTLILKADSIGQFIEYYGSWLRGITDGKLSNLNFESIVIQGLTAEEASTNEAFSELYGLFQNSGASVQYYGSDVDVAFADLATLDKVNFEDFGGTENDLLYVRVNEGDSLSDLNGLLADGSLTGAEGLMLDLVDYDNSFNLDGTALNSLLESLRGNDSNKDANVFLRYDDGDNIPADLASAGWETQGETANLNGQEYIVYTNSQDDALGNLYIQMITNS